VHVTNILRKLDVTNRVQARPPPWPNGPGY
jgi:hypothetical protein